MNTLTENEIYTELLDSMLTYAEEKGLDTSEGSVSFDMLAPAALAMTALYLQIEQAQAECFADTASLESLIRLAAERGIEYRAAQAPVVEISLANGEIDPQAAASERRFSLGALTFYAEEQTQEGTYVLVCDTPCAIGENADGPLTYEGSDPLVEGAALVRIRSRGRDDETAAELRARYFLSVQSSSFAGNRAAYVETAMSVAGVGGCKAQRAEMETDGANVLLTVISDRYDVPDADVLAAVRDAVDAVLPICHVAAVRAVERETADVSAQIILDPGLTIPDVRDGIAEKINEKLKAVCAAWAADGSATLRSSDIFTAVLSAEGVADAAQVTVSLGGESVFHRVFDGVSIPALGALTLTEVDG